MNSETKVLAIMNPETFTLGMDSGGGVWPGLIMPAGIVLIGLVAALAILLVTRSSGGGAGQDEDRFSEDEGL